MQPPNLQEQFDEAMVQIYRRAKAEANYNASIFIRMITQNGGLSSAKQLINADKESEGYTALWLKKRLDLTVEAVVLDNPKWHPLFSAEELERCKARLNDFGYFAFDTA